MYRCTYCEYSTPYLHNLKRHEKNKHYKAPTNTLFHPEVAYSSTELPQVRQGLPLQSGSGVLHTTQQYDPRSISQIQYNELNHQRYGPQHLTGYQVRQGGSGVLRCLLYTSPSPRDRLLSRMPSSA